MGLDELRINPILASIPEYKLAITNGTLSFRNTQDNHIIQAGFQSKQFKYRSKSHINAELLVKAVLGKKKAPLVILDATVGFGKDSYLLSLTGSKICAFESNPLMYLLLKDALVRENIKNITLHFKDSLEAMSKVTCDVVYLDPMYPETKKSAKNNKYMMFLQACVGHQDEMAQTLFLAALNSKAKKIVLKRPIKAGFILDKKPTSQILGKTTRFDVYAI